MDGLFLIAGLGAAAAPVVLVLLAALALWRKTRYFAIALVLGLVAGIVAAVSGGSQAAPLLKFLAAFTIVALPAAAVCALVGIIDLLERRSRIGVPKLFVVAACLFGLGALIVAADVPTAEATQVTGEVMNISVAAMQSGEIRQIVDIRLDDGRRILTEACRTIISPLTRQVRVNEYRRLLTRRRAYQVAGSSCSGDS
jgi:MFS family permease